MACTIRGRRVTRVVVAVAAALAGFACATPGGSPGRAPAEVTIGEEGAGSTVTLRRGQRLIVTLPGNPTTGYLWEVAAGAAGVLEQEGKGEFAPSSGALGAGGFYRFAFRAVSAGKAPLKLVYHRPFETGVPPASTFEVTVSVSE